MSNSSDPSDRQQTFGQTCEQVCREQGWELLPSGVRVATRDGRHQLVSLEFFEHEREELVRLYTTIGDARALDETRLTTALRLNSNLPHGALAIRANDLVMVDTLSLRDADPGEIETSLGYLAETADFYEKTMYGTDDY